MAESEIYGIDLGTTNSSIAILEGTTPEVIDNNENKKSTPSAVYINERGGAYTGEPARARAERDPDNAKIEFKRNMGTDTRYLFAASGIEKTPEELSAEVLKSLKEDVLQRKGRPVLAAVITVPAMFELPACQATERAARLAGIAYSPILQEPIAAGMAYGLKADNRRDARSRYWLIFDLGGGTFDASIVAFKEGRLSIIDHAGDNRLGGKDLDRAIIENFVLPALHERFSVPELKTNNPEMGIPLAKIREQVEKTKIALSRRESETIRLDEIMTDGRGLKVTTDLEMDRTQLRELIQPRILRATQICLEMLEKNGLAPSALEKMILVGGPTLSPTIREIIQEQIPIIPDYSIDPITVVAQGAAIYATTQTAPAEARPEHRPPTDAQYVAELSYPAMTSSIEEFVGIIVRSKDGSPPQPGCRIQLMRGDNGWESAVQELTETGTYDEMVRLDDASGPNEFQIKMTDSKGGWVNIHPNKFTIRAGIDVDRQPLPRAIGVALSKNRVKTYHEKHTRLPAIGKGDHQTVREFKHGDSADLLRIPLLEGEYDRADRNRLVGEILIRSNEIGRDLPKGSKVEVTLEVSDSRQLSARAYIPLLGRDFTADISLESLGGDVDELQSELDAQTKRLEDIRNRKSDLSDRDSQARIDQTVENIERQDALGEISQLVSSANSGEKDAAKAADERLKDVAARLDEAEGLLQWPELVSQARELEQETRGLVSQIGTPQAQEMFEKVEREMESAIQNRDPEALKARIQDMVLIGVKLLKDDIGFLSAQLGNFIEAWPEGYVDPQWAQRLIEQAKGAIRTGNARSAQGIMAQLYGLMRQEAQNEVPDMSDIE
jgi:molecular chaperone DnaK